MALRINTLGLRARKTRKRQGRLAISQRTDELFTLAENMAGGCKSHGADCGLADSAEASVRERLSAALAASNAYGTARAGQLAKTAGLQRADKAGRVFIRDTKAVLQKHLGTAWSAAYEPCGFPDQSLRIPTTRAKRAALVNSLGAYLEANPAIQVASMGVEIALATAVHKGCTDCTGDVNQGRAGIGVKKKTRDAKVRALRKRLRGVVDDLKETMPEDDPRWRAFGFIPPSSEPAPEAVENVQLSFLPDGRQLATWPPGARVERYRVRRQVMGLDGKPQLVASVVETQAVLPAVAPGATVRVQVIAVNGGGEARASAVAELAAPSVARVA